MMKGAKEYASLFKTGQYNKLYIVSGSHARGSTFRIYVIPADEQAISNGPDNPPQNKNAIEVYGIISGNRGWTEEYGWKYEGKWQDDFVSLVKQKYSEIEAAKKLNEHLKLVSDKIENDRITKLLEAY